MVDFDSGLFTIEYLVLTKKTLSMLRCFTLLFLLTAVTLLPAQTQLGNDILADSAPGRTGIGLGMSQDGNRLLVADDFYSPGNDIQIGSIQLWEWTGSAWVKAGAPVIGDNDFDKIGETITLSADGSRFAYGIGGMGFSSGLVRAYTFLDGDWVQLGPDFVGESSGERLGTGVSLSADGSYLAIGSASNSFAATPANVTVYQWDGSTWTQRGGVITTPPDSPAFGTTVLLSDDGNRLIVNDNFSNSSTASVFTYDWNGTDWAAVGNVLTGKAGSDSFGTNLALSADGNRLVVGAYNYDSGDNNNDGFAEVYDWTAVGWVQVGTTLFGEDSQRLGSAVALSDDGAVLAVGAEGDINTNGKVDLYTIAGGTLTLSATIEETGGAFSGEGLGASAALSGAGTRLAVGEPDYIDDNLNSNSGRVRVFDTGLTATTELPELTASFYPNPTRGVLRLNDRAPAAWTVSDALGRVYRQQTSVAVSLAALPAGSYVVRAVRAEGQLVRVVLKE